MWLCFVCFGVLVGVVVGLVCCALDCFCGVVVKEFDIGGWVVLGFVC